MFKKNENSYRIIGAKSSEVVESIPAGLHNLKIKRSFFGNEFNLEVVDRYKKARQPEGGVFAEAYAYMNRFFDPIYRKTREEMGMVNKLNVIFNGLPGTGKTHLACVLAEKLVKERDAIAVVMNDVEDIDFPTFIDNLRLNDDPDRLVVLILDEMEKNNHRDLKKPKFLGFLDGADSKENVIVIGTSNKISDLPDYLIDRPGRFEKIWDFKFTDVEVLKDTVKSIIPLDLVKDEEFVNRLAQNAHKDGVKTVDRLRFHILGDIFDLRRKQAGVDITPLVANKALQAQVEEKVGDAEDVKKPMDKNMHAKMKEMADAMDMPEELRKRLGLS